ncbi:MAG: hypothetical protein EZS28_014755 [Streblomastix strix]|uniref:RRM domain-containing protein n=1 Tax=Streblomastix strix TaxID=222440 RepID=A0A5J4W469_9EUKA|nr:MAG: hypothetical protein EZS28_014755 [Streblomastix strix]
MTQFGVLVQWKGSNIEQAILMKLFEPYQAVDVTIDQVRPDNNDRTAFVRFMTQQAAEYAQDQTDGLVIEEKKLDQKGLFIKNLNPITTEDDLKLIFSTYQFTQCKIPQSQTQDRPHYGFVDFKNEQDANRALEYSNGKIVDGYKIFVQQQTSSIQPPPPPNLMNNNNINNINQNPVDKRILFVRNINPLTTEENFRNAFAPFKAIKCDKKQNQRPNIAHFGWADFSNESDASRALQYFNNMTIEGFQWQVQYKLLHPVPQPHPVPQQQNAKNTSLFIYNLSPITTQQTLSRVFLAFGPSNVLIPQIQPDGKLRYGFINFSNKADANRAMKSLQGKEIDGANIRISYKKTKKQNKKKNQKGKGGFVDVPYQKQSGQNEKENDSQEQEGDEYSDDSQNPTSQPEEHEPQSEPENEAEFTFAELQDITLLQDVCCLNRNAAIRLFKAQGKDLNRAINSFLGQQ